jgi:hypothetical protein
MAIELATAYVSLTTSARGIEESVTKSMNDSVGAAGKAGDAAGEKISSGIAGGTKRAAGAFKQHIGGLAAITGVAFGADQVMDFFGSALDEAKESAKVSALTANVIKSTGAAAGLSADQVGNLATKISNYAGIDDEAVQAGENLLLTFTNVKDAAGAGNDVFSQSTALMADMSTALGTDMSSSAMQLGKALNDPIKGVSALARSGVSFTAQQKDQIKTLVASGDTLGAQKLMLAELKKEFGGAAAAAATPAAKLETAWGNFKEQIGTAVMPLVSKFATFMTTDVLPVLSSLAAFVERNAKVLGPLALAVGAIATALGIFVGVTKVATAVQTAFNVVMALNPIGLVVIAIVALVAGLILAYNKVGWFRDGVNAAFSWLKNAVSAAIKGIVAAFRWISEAAVTVKNWVVARWTELVTWVTGLPARISAAVAGLWNGLKNGVASAYNFVVGKLETLINWVLGMPRRVAGVLGNLFSPIYNSLVAIARRVAALWNSTIGKFSISIPKWIPVVGGKGFAFPKMPTFARGGTLEPGWNVVGERGAELVHKAGSSVQVYSHAASQGGLAGGGAGRSLTIGRLVEFSGPVHVRSDADVLAISRNVARQTNQRLRSLGVGISMTGTAP